MTQALRPATDQAIADLQAIADPIERYNRSRELRAIIDEVSRAVKDVQKQVAIELKAGRSWREVGELLGGISGSRAEQISRGV